MAQTTIRLDTTTLLPLLRALQDISERRGSLPEFRDRLLEIVEGIPGGLETARVDGEGNAASTCELVLSLQFGQALLGRVAALRAFDRDFDAVGRAHGGSFRED